MPAHDDQGFLNAAAIAVSSLATRKARPRVSAMSIQLFDTSIPRKRGSAMRRSPVAGVARQPAIETWIERAEKCATLARPFARRSGPLARGCNSGSGAHPTVRAQDRKGRMTDPDCLRTCIRSSDDLAVLPSHLPRGYPFAEAGHETYNPEAVARPSFPRIASLRSQ